MDHTADIQMFETALASGELRESSVTLVKKILELTEALEKKGQWFPSVEQFCSDIDAGNRVGFKPFELQAKLVEYRQVLQAVKNGVVRPRKIVGTGGTKPQAIKWIEDRIAELNEAAMHLGFLNTTNLGNYKSTLTNILEKGEDLGYKDDKTLDKERAASAQEEKTRGELLIELDNKARKYGNHTIETPLTNRSAQILTRRFSIQAMDAVAIVEAAEAGDAGAVGDFLLKNPRVKAIGDMNLNEAMEFSKAKQAGVKFHKIQFNQRKGYVLIEAEIDVSPSAIRLAYAESVKATGLTTDPTRPYGWENLPQRAIDFIVRIHGGDVAKARQKADEVINREIYAANKEVEALKDFELNGPGMTFKSTGGFTKFYLSTYEHGYRLYEVKNHEIVGIHNYGSAESAIQGAIHGNGAADLLGHEAMRHSMSLPEWKHNERYENLLRQHEPDLFDVALSTKHYSEQIIDTLVNDYGWNRSSSISAEKQVGGNAAGEINAEGIRIVSATFDTGRQRYLTLQYGFKDVFDIDCRDTDIAEAAKEFNRLTIEWARRTAADTETLSEEVAALPTLSTEEKERENRINDIATQYATALGQSEVRDFHTSFATAVVDKDYAPIAYLANGVNKTGVKLFFKLIGQKLPTTQKGQREAMMAWAGVDEAQLELKHAVGVYGRTIEQLRKDEPSIHQLQAWVERALQDGFSLLKTVDRKLRLINPESGKSYDLSKRGIGTVRELVKARLELLKHQVKYGIHTKDLPIPEAVKSQVFDLTLTSPESVRAYERTVEKLKNRYARPDGVVEIAHGQQPTPYKRFEVCAAIKYLGMSNPSLRHTSIGVTDDFIKGLKVNPANPDVLEVKARPPKEVEAKASKAEVVNTQQSQGDNETTVGNHQEAIIDKAPAEVANDWYENTFCYIKDESGVYRPDFSHISHLTYEQLQPYVDVLEANNAHSDVEILRAMRLGGEKLLSEANRFQGIVEANRELPIRYRSEKEQFNTKLSLAEAIREGDLLRRALSDLAFPGKVTYFNNKEVKKDDTRIYVDKVDGLVSIKLDGVAEKFTGETENAALYQLAKEWDHIKGAFLVKNFPHLTKDQAERLSTMKAENNLNCLAIGSNREVLGKAVVLKYYNEADQVVTAIQTPEGSINVLDETQTARVEKLSGALQWDHHFNIGSKHITAESMKKLIEENDPELVNEHSNKVVQMSMF